MVVVRKLSKEQQEAEAYGITQDKVMADLEEVKQICMGRKPAIVTTKGEDVEVKMFKPSEAIRATVLQGKQLGMFKEGSRDGAGNGHGQLESIVKAVRDIE